jgi:hypothetical protein
VLIKKGDETVKMKINKGIEDEKWIEVTGLTEATTIIVKP